jgi:hypothetical protein
VVPSSPILPQNKGIESAVQAAIKEEFFNKIRPKRDFFGDIMQPRRPSPQHSCRRYLVLKKSPPILLHLALLIDHIAPSLGAFNCAADIVRERYLSHLARVTHSEEDMPAILRQDAKAGHGTLGVGLWGWFVLGSAVPLVEKCKD